jgi:hypothetical protein
VRHRSFPAASAGEQRILSVPTPGPLQPRLLGGLKCERLHLIVPSRPVLADETLFDGLDEIQIEALEVEPRKGQAFYLMQRRMGEWLRGRR